MNIIYFHTHDSGRFLLPYGENTPNQNLLNFAKDALLFRNSFTVSPTCSPSRACMLTGTYPQVNGMMGLAHRGFNLKDYKMHLASFLNSNGYHTALCGVQHEIGHAITGDYSRLHALGYDEILTTPYDGKIDLVDWDLQNAENVCEFLEGRDQSKPFFLSFGLESTHREYPELTEEELENEVYNYVKVPPTMIDNEENRKDTYRFHKSCKVLDQCTGILMDKLKELDLYDDTLIVFTTDHGLANPFEKCNLNDRGLGVSFIVRNPKVSESLGKVSDALVSQIDLFPTICDIVNLPKPAYLQGNSFVNIFENHKLEHNKYVFSQVNFHTSYEPQRSVRTKRFRYVKYLDSYNKIQYSNIDNSAPKDLVMSTGQDSKELNRLYDLFLDPNEKNNLIHDKKYADVVSELSNVLVEFMKETNDPGLIDYPSKIKVNKRECVDPGSKDKEDYDVWDL